MSRANDDDEPVVNRGWFETERPVARAWYRGSVVLFALAVVLGLTLPLTMGAVALALAVLGLGDRYLFELSLALAAFTAPLAVGTFLTRRPW